MTSSAREQRVAQLTADAARIERQIAALKGDVGMELDEAACAYQKQHPDVSYSDALEAAMQESPNLAAEYIASFGTAKLSPEQARTFAVDDDEDDPGKEVDRLASKLQREHPDLTYEQCLDRVREDHPDLWRRYAGR